MKKSPPTIMGEGKYIKYKEVKSNQWIRPIMIGYKFCCCDCGLVHKMNFKVIRWGRGHKIIFKAFRDNRATGQVRRHKVKVKGKKNKVAM